MSGGLDGPRLASPKECSRADAVELDGGLRRLANSGPTSKTASADVERRLALALPAVVRDVCGSVGNGGYGLVGLRERARDDLGRDVVTEEWSTAVVSERGSFTRWRRGGLAGEELFEPAGARRPEGA